MKALIPAAGHGTRFAPFTRLIPKELLPIGSRPAIAHLVDEAAAAGADEVVIVTSPEKPLLQRWFEIEPPRVKLTWAWQREQRGLGHAVAQAEAALAGEARVLILLGDALVTGGNAAAEMARLSAAHDGAGVIGLERVPRERVSRYGIVRADAEMRIRDMVEKPRVEEAPSDLAVAGRYLLDGEIFRYLRDQAAGVGGEIQLTDAIRRMLAEKPVYGYVYPGRRLDIGNPDGYFAALEAFHGNG